MQGKGKSPGARVSSLGCREKKLLGKTGGLGWLEEGERGFPLLGKEGKGLLKGVMSFRNLHGIQRQDGLQLLSELRVNNLA